MVFNIKLPELNKSKFMEALKGTASRAAETIASMGKPKGKVVEPGLTVTAKCGKPGTPFRKIIRQEAMGVQFIQTGIRVVAPGEGRPILERVERHRFLHATKGWRVYRDGLPGMARCHTPSFARNPAKQSKLAPWRPAKMVNGHIIPLDAAA